MLWNQDEQDRLHALKREANIRKQTAVSHYRKWREEQNFYNELLDKIEELEMKIHDDIETRRETERCEESGEITPEFLFRQCMNDLQRLANEG
jgi:hypothetical protein